MRDDYVHLAQLRLDWANMSIDRLEVLVDTFLATKPCEVFTSMEREGEDAHFTYTLHIVSQPPTTVRFATGDVIHNLRATLDNLVWGVGQVFKADDDLGLEFYKTPSTFLERYAPKIGKLPKPIYDWIESIQPYRGRRNVRIPHTLHELWNFDKHRAPTLVSTAGVSGNVGIGVSPIKSIRWSRTSSGMKDQEEIMSAIVPWERRHDFKPEFLPLVAFHEDGPVGINKIVWRPESIVPYFRHVQEYILTRIVPKFEPYR